MARKLKIGDKIVWSKTLYSIDDIDESKENDQILFTWFDGRYKSIYHSTVCHVEKGLAENEIHFYEPMTMVKEIEKFKFSN